MKGKLHFPLLSFLAGAIYAHAPDSWALFALCLLWFLFFTKLRFLFPLLLLGFFLGVYVYSPSEVPSVPSDPPFYGEILSPAVQNGRVASFPIQTSEHLEYQVIHFVDYGEDSFFTGLEVGARCKLMAEHQEFPVATNEGQFDFATFMKNQGVEGQFIIEKREDIFCEGSSWKQTFYEQRSMLIDTIMDKSDTSLNPWINALVFGDQQGLKDEVSDLFRELGMSHILAISGLHVGLFAGMIYTVFYRTGLVTSSQVRVLVFLTLPLFAFVAGAAPSVMRASLMAIFLVGLSALKIRSSMTDLLSLVAFLLLFMNPDILHHPGFQFSFAVTFSLLLSSPLLSKDTNPWIISLRVSFIAQLAILPLQLHYFYQFSPLSVFFNLILVPYFTIVFIPFIFLLLLSVFLLPAFVYEWISRLGAGMHTMVMDTVVNVGGALNIQWITGIFPYTWFLPYYICFFLMMIFLVNENKRNSFVSGVALVSVLATYSALPYLSGTGTVTFLDVGQGDSAVIELPFRKGVIMIDAAGPPVFQENKEKIADTVILPFLKSRGIAGVDALFITHNDTDHNGSVPRLVEKDALDSLFISAYDEREYDGKASRLSGGDRYEIGGYAFDILGPERDLEDKNDDSLIIYTELGGKRWLFTGDISSEVEKEVAINYPDLTVDFLKVAHHGSITSTSDAFMDAFRPDVGVISAGRDNRYGHPHGEVLDRLASYGTEVWRTDLHGAVSITFYDDRLLEKKGFMGP
ncbi:DNA internalization-related competence protein ComEC/Rec2 [Salimicrobium halophilum]|uniref:Competence protein ComEC n=1 Tax=Salimicrobium halophilum TaxID=86666 RepID=A0A1G8PP02_9BACI|nr:DNA internalization-related competence protein ComEC/Rec2 [Salimicrobium halophilum]SDI94207.1 competence protein ComEC [Salimicrobium halophilum]